jgi:hypothetical protein
MHAVAAGNFDVNVAAVATRSAWPARATVAASRSILAV